MSIDKMKHYKGKYITVFNNRILPKKKVMTNTKIGYERSLEIMQEYEDLRKEANDAVLGGKPIGEKRD